MATRPQKPPAFPIDKLPGSMPQCTIAEHVDSVVAAESALARI